MRALRVEIPRRVLESFKRAAKKAFPREAFAYLIGQDAGDLLIIEDLYFPTDQGRYAGETGITVPPHWEPEARAHAKEQDATLVGDIHSHPRRFSQWKGQLSERTPSEGDHAQGWRGLCGICVIAEQSDGRLRASIRFFGPSFPVHTKVTG